MSVLSNSIARFLNFALDIRKQLVYAMMHWIHFRSRVIPNKSAQLKNYFSYFSTKIYVVDTQKNHDIETILLCTKIYCLI